MVPALPFLLATAYIAVGARAQSAASSGTSASASASASACATLSPKNPAPSMASGWRASVVASNLTSPRVVVFDGEGGLLVSESGVGISRITFEGEGECVGAGRRELLLDNEEVSLGFRFGGSGWSQDGFLEATIFVEKRYAGYC